MMRKKHWLYGLAVAGLLGAGPAAWAQHEEHHEDKPAEHARASDPYTLRTCPVSGEELGSMGDAVVRVYDGREVRFCCEKCVPKFEADRDAYFKKIDQAMIKDQKPWYPLTVCPISGHELGDEPIDLIYRNRLVRFCCEDCIEDFKENPDAVLKKLDAAVIAQQKGAYPLSTCPASDEPLGEMGEPRDMVVANRLVRLCCKSCAKDVKADPLPVLAALDKAWKAIGMPTPLDHMPKAADGDGHGEHSGQGEHEGHGGKEHGGGR